MQLRRSLPCLVVACGLAVATSALAAPPGSGRSPGREAEGVTGAFLTALPVDLAQIARVSRFRSCAVADYSGAGAQGLLESRRSLTHHFAPLPALTGRTHALRVAAPADGVIASVVPHADGNGVEVRLVPAAAARFVVWLSHVDLVPGLGAGSRVRAGRQLGWAALATRNDFDVAVTSWLAASPAGSPLERSGLAADESAGSLLFHAAPAVQRALAERGLSVAGLVIPRAVRDAAPCRSFGGADPADWVAVRRLS